MFEKMLENAKFNAMQKNTSQPKCKKCCTRYIYYEN